MEAAVGEHRPQLIVCPMLKTRIPESIWSTHRCLIVHPGPAGDRGPSSLDWAIALGMREWGVTVLEASAEFDAGDIWATRTFATRPVGKSSLIATRCAAPRSARRRGDGRHRRRREPGAARARDPRAGRGH